MCRRMNLKAHVTYVLCFEIRAGAMLQDLCWTRAMQKLSLVLFMWDRASSLLPFLLYCSNEQ
jgi:hypothetical protein